MKKFKIIFIFLLTFSSSATLFFAIKYSSFYKESEINNKPEILKKPIFESEQWKIFIDQNGNIDHQFFNIAFFTKLKEQTTDVEDFKISFEDNKILVQIFYNGDYYKWHYELIK